MINPIRLARTQDYPAGRMVGLNTHIALSESFVDSIDLIHEGIGKTVPQGSFFAYLWRRFGYPNVGWDDGKELVSYLLTTTHPGMLVRITPYAGGDSSISISFLVPMDAAMAARKWESRSRNAWRDRMFDWIEAENHLPRWLHEYVAKTRENALKSGQASQETVDAITWRNLFDGLGMMSYAAKKAGEADERGDWHDRMVAAWTEIEPEPGLDYRDKDWTTWSENDPLRPYAEAIVQTLGELKRPVWVRDCPITPQGPVDDQTAIDIEDEIDALLGCEPPRAASEVDIEDARYEVQSARLARAAGYPSGDLGNADPELFAKLHAAVLRLGDGDPVVGMTKALAALPDSPSDD